MEPASAPTRVDLHPMPRISGLESSQVGARPTLAPLLHPCKAMALSAIDVETLEEAIEIMRWHVIHAAAPYLNSAMEK